MSFWDERFSQAGYVYGTEPNRWLAAQAGRFPAGGRILSIGEGEGRNAVWLAGRGHSVTAVDGSAVGLAKARRLAAERGVELQTAVADLASYRPEPAAYDGLLLVYLHLPSPLRQQVHTAAAAALRPGGVLVIEAFTPAQLLHQSGGPRQADLLYSAQTLRADFPEIEWSVLEELDVELDEGAFHQGPAAVVRGVGIRRE